MEALGLQKNYSRQNDTVVIREENYENPCVEEIINNNVFFCGGKLEK